MSMLKLNVADVPELQILPDDEYEVRIISAEIKTVDNENSKVYGASFLNIRMEAVDHPEAEDIYTTLWLPRDSAAPGMSPEDLKKSNDKSLRKFGEFGKCFGIDFDSGVDVGVDLPGCVGRASLSSKSDPEYGDKQTVRKFLPTR